MLTPAIVDFIREERHSGDVLPGGRKPRRDGEVFSVGSRDSSLSKRDWLTLETGKNEEGRRDTLVAEVKALLADASAASKRMISDLPGKLVLRLPNQGRIGILFAVGPVSEND